MSSQGRCPKGDDGAAAIEFALIFAFFVLLVFGSFELARAWNVHNVMDHAAREGARFGATEFPWDSGTSVANVQEKTHENLAAANVDIAMTAIYVEHVEAEGSFDGTGAPEGCSYDEEPPDAIVVVCVPYPEYELNFIFFRTTIDMQAVAIARHES
jgi:hypothetical protein